MKITLSPITTQFGFQQAINERLKIIQDAFNNSVLFREEVEGEPNTMSGDLDMGGKDIINCQLISATDFKVGGIDITEGLTELAEEVQEYSEEAEASATSAASSAESALSSSTSATASASSAATYAATATTKATEAASSASSASTSATSAEASATTATTKATEASSSATSAASSASSASTSATTATTKATEASSSASKAQVWAEGTEEQVEELGGDFSSKDSAVKAYAVAESPFNTPVTEYTTGNTSVVNIYTNIQVFSLSDGENELQTNRMYANLTALSTLTLSFLTPTNTQDVNIIGVTFVSGDTPTTLTLPTDDVILPADFSAVLANKKYELSFLYLPNGKWDMEWSVKDAV